MGSRVELFAAVRFDWQRHGSSIRALADKYGVHRRTVRQAIESVVPPERRSPQRATPVLNQVRGWIDEMLRQDLDAPRKQRHTARRIFDRLVDEHDASVSYSYGRNQPVKATPALSRSESSWSSASAGVRQPSRLRGLVLSCAATNSR
jgi:hypothetical protein